MEYWGQRYPAARPRLAPDRAATLGVIAEFGRGDRGFLQLFAQSQVRQNADRVRQQVNADAQGPKLLHGFVDGNTDALLVQAKCGDQSADATARD
jgi:hypothetical protein